MLVSVGLLEPVLHSYRGMTVTFMPWPWAHYLAKVALVFVIWGGEIQGDARGAVSQFKSKLFHPVEP